MYGNNSYKFNICTTEMITNSKYTHTPIHTAHSVRLLMMMIQQMKMRANEKKVYFNIMQSTL